MTSMTPEPGPAIPLAETAHHGGSRLDPFMFWLSLTWLAALAVVLHFHERPEDAAVFWTAVTVLGLLTPIFWIETADRWRRGAVNRWHAFWCAVLPPLRLGLRDAATGTQLWLPKLGWRTVTPRLQEEVDRAFSGPILAVSLLVLPVVLIEVGLPHRIEADVRLARATELATALIWWTFTVEFLLMVSLTDRRLEYCKKHWLDLAIILLPLIAFLRMLRLGRLLQLQQISKTARMYKLRGVTMRSYRALLLIGAINRLLQGKPERRLEKLQQKLREHEQQAELLREEIAELQARIAPPTQHAA